MLCHLFKSNFTQQQKFKFYEMLTGFPLQSDCFQELSLDVEKRLSQNDHDLHDQLLYVNGTISVTTDDKILEQRQSFSSYYHNVHNTTTNNLHDIRKLLGCVPLKLFHLTDHARQHMSGGGISFSHQGMLHMGGGDDPSKMVVIDTSSKKCDVIATIATLPKLSNSSCAQVHDHVFMLGGYNHNTRNLTNILYKYDIPTRTCIVVEQQDEPPPQDGHLMWCQGDDVWLLGGLMDNRDNGHQDDTVYKFSTTTTPAKWNKVETSGKFPRARQYAAYCVQSNMMYLYGGYDENGVYSNDLHSFNMETCKWRKLEIDTTANVALPRVRKAAMVCHNNKLLILGGYNSDEEIFSSTLYKYDLTSEVLMEVLTLPDLQTGGQSRGFQLRGHHMHLVDGGEGARLFIVGGGGEWGTYVDWSVPHYYVELDISCV